MKEWSREEYQADVAKMRARGDSLVFVHAFLGDEVDPADNYVMRDDDLFAQLSWVPKGMSANLVLPKTRCQEAAEGDEYIRRYIKSMARRSILRTLMRDYKQVYGPDWVRGLEFIVKEERAKEERDE
jgi:hypothetical protein